MLLYVWSREFPNAQINIYGLVSLKVGRLVFIRKLLIGCVGCISQYLVLVTSTLIYLQAFYLPWAMLALDVIFGSKILPDLLGIIAGHLYYFLTVLHPLAGGKIILKTPMWVYPYIFGLFTASSIYCNPEKCFSLLSSV
jgi:Derlin-2/3